MSDHQLTVRINLQSSTSSPDNNSASTTGFASATADQANQEFPHNDREYSYHHFRIAIALTMMSLVTMGVWLVMQNYLQYSLSSTDLYLAGLEQHQIPAVNEQHSLLNPLIALNQLPATSSGIEQAPLPQSNEYSQSPSLLKDKQQSNDKITSKAKVATKNLRNKIDQVGNNHESQKTPASEVTFSLNKHSFNKVSFNKAMPIQIFSSQVVRAQFTTTIANHEPADNIDSLIDRRHGLNEISFFTEVRGMKDDELIHTWSFQGNKMEEMIIPVNGKDWRSFSKKYLDPDMAGIWQVVVTNKAGNTLAAGFIDYQIVD